MVTAPLPESCWDGQATVWLWSGHAAYWGPSLQLDAHSGSVDCFALGLDAPFLVRSHDGDRTVRSALIPARTTHQLVADEGRMMFFYVDPSAAGSGSLRSTMLDRVGTIAYGHRDESALVSEWRHAPWSDAEILRQRLLGVEHASPMDERIAAAMRILRARPTERVSAAELAAAVHLSPSRFLHLFSAHAGTSLRRYRLWVQMQRVAGAIRDGADLTTAAVEAGFASPSHFSDAFRAMFGLSATALISGPTRIVVPTP